MARKKRKVPLRRKPTFKFAPSILSRLGEELVPNLDQAIIELVRNAYDADATRCEIALSNTKVPGGEIKISDNGRGMTRGQIVDGWLLLGGSSKSASQKTPGGRLVVGDKGLGRLAAMRAGSSVKMTTRVPGTLPSAAHSLEIKWSVFDKKRVVEDVALEVKRTSKPDSGTEITLSDLTRALTGAEIDRLGRALVLLTSPFKESNGFAIKLHAASYPELEKRVEMGYLNEAELVLEASIRQDGSAVAEVKDWKGAKLYSGSSVGWGLTKGQSPNYAAPVTKFQLYVYVLNRETFTGRGATIGEVREWLKMVGGVHLYHRGFRVPPYGDAGFDWLDMNLSRARSPEERPSTNTSVGRVVIEDPLGRLRQKTDRFGFIDSVEFNEIRRFAKDALEWFARQRLRDAERRREAKRSTKTGTENAREELVKTIQDSVPGNKQGDAIKAIERFEKSLTGKMESIKEDLLLYRSLATAGTTAAVFAHEIGHPIGQIASSVKGIRLRVANVHSAKDATAMSDRLDIISRSCGALEKFAGMQIDFLKREKRRQGVIDVNKVVSDLLDVWEPILETAKIKPKLNLHPGDLIIYGAESLVETVVTNCMTNSVRAFESDEAPGGDRIIIISTSIEGGTVVIDVEDNGPGFTIPLSEVWLPGRTTRLSGTGFGLTIVKDSVQDMGGKYEAFNRQGRGAHLRFVFPAVQRGN
ncbi:MAG: ATP-binding protein [Luteimonas sp.]